MVGFENFLILVSGYIKEVKVLLKSLDRVAEYLFEYLSHYYEEEILVKQFFGWCDDDRGRKIPPFLKNIKKYEKDFIQIEQNKGK